MRFRAGTLSVLLLLTLDIVPLPFSARAEPAKPDQLILREWPGPWGDAMVNTVARTFTEQTGIPVVIDHRQEAVMSTLIQGALAQHRQPPIDVFYALAPSAAEDEARGLMDDLDPADIPNLNSMLPLAKPASSSGGWPYVNVGVDIVTLLYRKSKFPTAPPDTVNVMFDPAFKGRILLYSPGAGSDLGLIALARHWSIPADLDKIWAFVADTVKPQQPILGGDADVVGGFERNEIDLAFSYPAIARRLSGNGIDVGWTKTKEGMMGIYEVAWIPRGLPESNRYWARKYIDLLLSRESLSTYCTALFIPCFRSDLPVPEALANDATYPKTPEELEALATVPPDVFAAHQAEWDAHFDEIMK